MVHRAGAPPPHPRLRADPAEDEIAPHAATLPSDPRATIRTRAPTLPSPTLPVLQMPAARELPRISVDLRGTLSSPDLDAAAAAERREMRDLEVLSVLGEGGMGRVLPRLRYPRCMLKPVFAFATCFAVAAGFAGLVSTAPACSSSSSGGGGGGAYCSARAGWAQRCNITDACTQAEVRDCAKISPSLSAAAQSAAQACAANLPCPVDGGTPMSSCFSGQVLSATPTAAQQKLAQDVCNVCAQSMMQTPAQCTANFFTGADGGGGSLGQIYLTYSDDIVTKIDQTCAPSLSADAGVLGCDFGLLLCASLVIQQNSYRPPECMQDAGGFTPTDGGFTFGD